MRTIYNKALQILESADDLDIITRDIRSLDTVVDNIEGAADDIGLQLNISKTKYMFSTKNKSQSQLICSLTLWSRKFEVVNEFICLGTQITADNNISAEISGAFHGSVVAYMVYQNTSARKCFLGQPI